MALENFRDGDGDDGEVFFTGRRQFGNVEFQ